MQHSFPEHSRVSTSIDPGATSICMPACRLQGRRGTDALPIDSLRYRCYIDFEMPPGQRTLPVPWPGLLLEGGQMAPPPVSIRAIAFIDGQNLFNSAKEAFGYHFPNYDVLRLSQTICAS
jgi:hypothetical protein